MTVSPTARWRTSSKVWLCTPPQGKHQGRISSYTVLLWCSLDAGGGRGQVLSLRECQTYLRHTSAPLRSRGPPVQCNHRLPSYHVAGKPAQMIQPPSPAPNLPPSLLAQGGCLLMHGWVGTLLGDNLVIPLLSALPLVRGHRAATPYVLPFPFIPYSLSPPRLACQNPTLPPARQWSPPWHDNFIPHSIAAH